MAKKKTKLDKMSKKEKTSLAYALATNLAKHGKPQTPKNERKLTKGEEDKKEKHVMKFKDSFDLEEQFSDKHDNHPALKGKQAKLPDALQKAIIKKTGGKVDEGILMALAQQVMKDRDLRSKPKTAKEELPKNYNFYTGKFNEDIDLGHQDDEPYALKKDLYKIAKYASDLYVMVNNFDVEGMEVDFPHWWQSKIIKAKDMIISAKHYLDGELTVPQIDITIGEDMDINDPILVKQRADKMKREKETNAPKPKKSINPNFNMVKNASKIKFLEREKAQLMRDMEQEAEPEGGPIADRYGAQLNRIDRAIDKLKKSPTVKEGLPKGFFDKAMKAKDEKVNEDYDSLVNKLKKQGKSEKAAKAIAGAVASYKAKGGGKGPTAKQK